MYKEIINYVEDHIILIRNNVYSLLPPLIGYIPTETILIKANLFQRFRYKNVVL